MTKNVLFFDSGIGGLSVYLETARQNPGIRPLYLFDNLNFPYGIQPDEVVVGTVCALIKKFTETERVDLAVVACNTASTVALDRLRETVDIPVVGVVPAIKPAAGITRNGIIGLLATPATVRRPYTRNLIDEFAAGKRVLCIGSSELVEIAERKIVGLPYDAKIIAHVLEEWRRGDARPDTVVLGCTHFPHLRAEIQEALPGCALVDSGDAIARRVKSLLGADPAEADGSGAPAGLPRGEAFCTDGGKISAALQRSFAKFGFASLRAFG